MNNQSAMRQIIGIEKDQTKRSKYILLTAISLFILALSFLTFLLFGIEKAIHNYKKSVEAISHVDSIRENLEGIRAENINGNKGEIVGKRAARINSIDSSFRELESNFSVDHEQTNNLEIAKGQWTSLSESKKPSESRLAIEAVLDSINQKELDKIYFQGPGLIREIDNLVPVTLGIGFLTIILLIFSFNSLIKENREKKRLLEELAKARDEALVASQLKSKFLATVSHEIRTPLNGVIGLSDILRKDPSLHSHEKTLSIIYESGKTLLKIISDILDFSKVESGAYKLDPRPFNLSSTINRVVETLRPKASEKGLIINLDTNLEGREWFEGDEDRLSQVLFNLIGNAVKFTSKGGVTVKICQINNSANNKKLIKFEVQDTGIGIPSRYLSHLFNPFYQIDKTGTNGEPGSGLGLSISQQIIQLMGGKIEVKSIDSLGSNFFFEIELPTATPLVKEVPSQASFDKNMWANKSVLVVEDNTANQLVITSMLDILNVKHQVVSSGRDALDVLTKEKFDLIFMDYQMPGIDGIHTTSIIRLRDASTPIVALTASVTSDIKSSFIESGMNGVLAKPVNFDELSDVLKKFLNGEDYSKNDEHRKGKLLNWDELIKLENVVGKSSVSRIINAFLFSLDELEGHLNDQSKYKQRLFWVPFGHKYKSSSKSLGGNKLSAMCEKLENNHLLNDADFENLLNSMKYEIELIRNELSQYDTKKNDELLEKNPTQIHSI